MKIEYRTECTEFSVKLREVCVNKNIYSEALSDKKFFPHNLFKEDYKMGKYNFDAVIFDLDGVITKTALVHSAAWKKMFDEFLKDWHLRKGEDFTEFSHESDYLPYVDGKPRYKGVESFLQSRGINLPFGNPDDSTEDETVCGLGNRKNLAFNEVLDSEGVEVYPSTVQLIHNLIAHKIHVGVASSSKNCKVVLEKAGLIDLFETRVDGIVSAEMGLHGKPEPDIFTTAADNMGVTYDRSVVVEDAVSGVQAGKAGNFGLVLGIARENNQHELTVNGSDLVVSDIDEIGLNGIDDWFNSGLERDNWSVTYPDYVPEKEKTRETLLTVGNGYIGTRGSMEESIAGETNYPGSYMAGLYNRLSSKVGERNVENEDFVNFINWSCVKFQIDDEGWLNLTSLKVLSIQRNLDIKTGIYSRDVVFGDKEGRETRIQSERWASMENPHLTGQRYELTPLNYSGIIKIKSVIDGNLINDGVERYKQLNQHHIKPVNSFSNEKGQFVQVETTQSKIQIAVGSKLIFKSVDKLKPDSFHYCNNEGFAATSATANIAQGQSFILEKLTEIYSSQEWDTAFVDIDAQKIIKTKASYSNELQKSANQWNEIWKKIDIKIEGDRLAQKLLRLHLYHLMVSLSPYNTAIDASITARGLHGEAYRGHIFWDELFILPLYNMYFPEVVKSTLMYRYRRLDSARAYAREFGYKGAMFPWQSGSDGREETQVVHLNPLTGKWGSDYSSYQRHVSLAVAYNTWQYVHASNDLDFLANNGAEMFLEICRFWMSKAIFDEKTQRYSIQNVMGPDEFHEKYPGSKDGGLKDNAYTNIMVVWAVDKGFELLDKLSLDQKAKVTGKLKLSIIELEQWKKIASGLTIIIKDDILAQYDGYFDLKELDWDYFKKKYGNIYRMDRLLKAEGESADDYKVAKQADTLQTFYNLNEETVTAILKKLGYNLSGDYLAKNLAYYLARTSHGSTLSRVVHAQLANIINDQKLSWELYSSALTSDYSDIQGGTTGEGIHAGVMAGTILIAIQSFAGLNLKGEIVKFEPHLPVHWRSIGFKFTFKNIEYSCTVKENSIEILQNNENGLEVTIEIQSKQHLLQSGKLYNIQINN